MKKVLRNILAIIMIAALCLATACSKPREDVLSVSMDQTASQVQTNVGIVLYSEVKLNGTAKSDATVEYTVEGANATTATIDTIDGQYYFAATQDGTYTIKATATSGELTASITKEVVVDQDVNVSGIYNVGYNPDGTANLNKIVVSKDGYYYGRGSNPNSIAFFQDLWALNNSAAYSGDFEFTISVKRTDASGKFFFSFHGGAPAGFIADFMAVENDGAKALGGEKGGNLDFSNLVYLKLVRQVGASETTFAIFTSNDGVNYTQYQKTTSTNDIDLNTGVDGTQSVNADITGLHVYCNGAIFFGHYTMSSTITQTIA